MPLRQQVLYLWLEEGSLDDRVVGWAFHDGTRGLGSGLPEVAEDAPPYATGVAALEDGWFLLQSPVLHPVVRGAEHEISYLPNEFILERRIEIPRGRGDEGDADASADGKRVVAEGDGLLKRRGDLFRK